MKSKKLFGWGYVVCFIMAISVLWNCEHQEISIEEETLVSKVLPFTSLPQNMLSSLKKVQDRVGDTKTEGLEVFVVDQSQVISTLDSLGNVNYSIKLLFEDQPENVLYNLILRADVDGNSLDPYAMKYTISNLAAIQMGDHLDLTRMNATIDIYFMDTFLEYVDNYLNRNDTTCPDDTLTYGGGDIENPDENNNDPTDDSGGCDMWVWMNGETEEWHTITWSCSDGNEGSVDLRSTDCPDDTNTSGGTGINQGVGCPNGMVADSNGVCICPASNMVYNGSECVCDVGFAINNQGQCINPCDAIRTSLDDPKMQDKITYIKGRLNKTQETGYKVSASNGFEELTVLDNGHSLDFGKARGYKGFVHNHLNPFPKGDDVIKPILMFSPNDIINVLAMTKLSVFNGIDRSEVYGMMITSDGTYMLKYSGSLLNIPDNFNEDALNRRFKRKLSGKNIPEKREKAFLEFVMDEIGIDGIDLFKVNDDGSIQRKSLSTDTANPVNSNPC